LESRNITKYSVLQTSNLNASQDSSVRPASGQGGPVRSLPQVKDKILKYDTFLQKNKTELDGKELSNSLNGSK